MARAWTPVRGVLTTNNKELVEHLVGNLKVDRLRLVRAQHVLLIFLVDHRKIPVAWKTQQKLQAQKKWQKLFFYMYELSMRHPVWAAEINVTACNSVIYKMNSKICTSNNMFRIPIFQSAKSNFI
jgi:hypothetical protein